MSDEPTKTLPKMPRLHATPFGTVMVLGNTGNLVADVQRAIDAADGAALADFTDDEIYRLLQSKTISAGLRAEAGYAVPPMTTIFHTQSELTASGKRLGKFLTLSPTSAGVALYWNVAVMDSDLEAICFATLTGAETALTMLRKVAGGPSTDVFSQKVEVPTDEDLEP